MQGPAAVGQGLEHGRAEGQPLGIGVRTKPRGDAPQVVGTGLLAVEMAGLPNISAQPLDEAPGHHRPHIIEHQTGDRHPGGAGLLQGSLPSQQQADETAHAGAHPIQMRHGRLGLQLRHQGQHVARIGRQLVGHRVGQPVAVAAPRHIGAHHAQGLWRARTQGLGQHIEVAPLAAQAVHTQHHALGMRVAPLPVRHAPWAPVGRGKVGAFDKVQFGLGCDG